MSKIWIFFIITIVVSVSISADAVRFAENENYGYMLFSDSSYFDNDKVFIVKFDSSQSVIIIDSINCFQVPQLSDSNIVSFIDYSEDSSRLITLTLTPNLKIDTILVYSQPAQFSYLGSIKDVYCLKDYKYIAKDSMLFWKSTGGSNRNVLEIGKINSNMKYERLNSFLEIPSYRISNDFSRIFFIRYNIGLQYGLASGSLSFISYFDLNYFQEKKLIELDLLSSDLTTRTIYSPIYFIGEEYSTENQNLYKFVNDSVIQLTNKKYPEIVREFYLFKDSISYTTAFTFYRCCDADTGIVKHILIE